MHTYAYPRPALTVDTLIIDTATAAHRILLILRNNPPFAGMWALPGGFVNENEDLLTAALRETQEETGLEIDKNAFSVREIGAFGTPNRDPRGWTVSIAFAVSGDFSRAKVAAADDADDARWFDTQNLPELAFDHQEIIKKVFL